MASYRKRGTTWRAEIRRRGHQPISATFDTKAAAVAWAAQREGEIMAGRRGQIIPRTVRQGLERYRDHVAPTHRGARWETVRIGKFLGTPDKRRPDEVKAPSIPFIDRLMNEVRTDDIAAWRDRLLTTLATASARREYGLMRSVFAVAVSEWRWLHDSPFTGVKPPAEGKARTRRVADEEIDRILLALNYERGTRPGTSSQFIAAACIMAVETAMRQGELLTLDHESLRGRIVHLDKTKNGDERDVPLSTRALALLDLLPSEGRAFPVAAATFDTLFRRARIRAGLDDVHFHDLRREATTRMAAKVDAMTLAKITGHRDLKVLLRTYYAPRMEDVASLLD